MRVTITGANGFMGLHLVKDQLARGSKVQAVDVSVSRLQELGRNPLLEIMRADIRDEERMCGAVAGSDIVFHLASAHLSVALPEEEYWKINHQGSLMFVKLCHRSGVRRFVHCSSVGVHGAIKNPPANEDSECAPDLVYERSKLEGERAIRQYAHENGYPVVIVRPVWVYGPGCPRTAKLLRAIKKGRVFFVGRGPAHRHCIYVSDMTEAFHLCAEHPNAPGKVFIVGDHAAVPVRELIGVMASAIGAPVPWLSLPLSVVRPLCILAQRAFTALGKEPPLSERSIKFFTNNTSFDTSRASREIGFVPKVSLEEGMRLTCAAMGMAEPPR